MGTKKVRILIVEDMIFAARDIKMRLEHMGYSVCGIVDNGPDAIKVAELDEPDIVLMDITLKGEMTGLDAARKIGAFSDTPVIFLTAHTDKSTLDSGKEISSHGFFTKPFREVELQAAIQQAIISRAMKNYLEEDKNS